MCRYNKIVKRDPKVCTAGAQAPINKLTDQLRAEIARAGSADAKAAASMARTQFLPQLAFMEDLSRGDDPVYAFGTRLRQGRFTQADFALNSLNHPPAIYRLIQRLGVPYDAHIHDYALICPRISLVGTEHRYCGEPDLAGCEACVVTRGRLVREDIGVAALRKRSAAFLAAARRVVIPSHDAATRLRRYIPNLEAVVIPHGDDRDLPAVRTSTPRNGVVRVCVAGGVGPHKGYDILLACARDAAERSLALEFVVVGDTTGDDALHATGRVFVTGTYRPEEAVELIRRQYASLAFLPSVWPETWSLTLTELWQAGLAVVAFDMGAPAERIRATGRGLLLPFGLPASAINDALLAAARTSGHEGLRRLSLVNRIS